MIDYQEVEIDLEMVERYFAKSNRNCVKDRFSVQLNRKDLLPNSIDMIFFNPKSYNISNKC